MPLQLELAENRTAFSPGEILAGTASWQLSKPPREAELRLVWQTRGKGSPDSEIVSTTVFPAPQAADTRPFKVTLPDAPYSFSGQLITLLWAVELVLQPGDECARREITLGPGGREVVLPRISSG